MKACLILLICLAAGLLAAGCVQPPGNGPATTAPATPASTPAPASPAVTPVITLPGTTGTSPAAMPTPAFAFGIPKKSAHYESNTPAHEMVLAGVPINMVIDFNFDLHDKSEIRILKDGTDYGAGPTTVDPNRLTLRRAMDPSSPDGLYTVTYDACWPDGSCHDGAFQFAIDRGLAAGFTDLTGQGAVTVVIRDLAFTPADIIISPGTNVTWINEDTVDHSVNTDSHPAHTYYPPQNSRVFPPGESHSAVFMTPGIYPYHCSVHPFMRGAILVQ